MKNSVKFQQSQRFVVINSISGAFYELFTEKFERWDSFYYSIGVLTSEISTKFYFLK